MTRESDNEREFYVIQFIELPFENIDDYVCVPYTWLQVRKATYDKVVVAYPKDEDPSDTRDRVKRKERHNDKWRFYMATVKYKSDSYDDAEYWIATRNDYGPLVEKVTDKQPKLPFNKKLRSAYQAYQNLWKSDDNFRRPLPISIKQPGNTETKKVIDEKRLKQQIYLSAPSSSAVVNDDNQSMECFQTEEDSQQRPELRIGISIKPKDRKRKFSLHGVTKTPPLTSCLTNSLKSIRQTSTYHNYSLLNNPQLQARMSPRSTGDNNVDFTTSPQNIIASETGDRQITEIAIRPIYQPSRIRRTTVHENGYQNLCSQEQLVTQSTQINSEPKRVHFMDDAARSSVTGSHINVMENASQRDEYIVKETLFPYHVVTSDAVTDHEEISDREMSADDSPVETTDSVYGTANDPRHDSAHRPTADQNSTSTNDRTHSKCILEQQMLDNFAILFTKMDSSLRYTTDMYNTLRSSILDTADIYKKLLRSIEQFNTAGYTASSASPSSNLTHEGPRSPEATHSKVASASPSNKDQHRNNVANKTPKNNILYRFVLPPEYDAYDTRWTLKYRTNGNPGHVELIPQSGVYVNYGDLKYCQLVSKDCKSLARRLLPKVFNRKALSVCSSMSEKAQASNNVDSTLRPDLDDHACSVLLNLVLEHGLQHGWNTDLEPILRTLHSKMLEIRFKYGVMVEC